MTEFFNFYGLTIQVTSASDALTEEVRRHFAYFRVSSAESEVQVEMRLEPPPYAELPSLPAAVFTPRNVCFHNKRISYIDYFGKGLAIFDRNDKHCVIYSTDHDLVHEIAYLFILSTAGEHLDSRGMHRVHALGVSYRDRGILLLLPSGGGKSTMALELMRKPGFLLLGEDTPVIDRRGNMHPFPLRMGVRAERDTGIPPQYLRTVNRMEFDPKTLIDIEYFKDRIGKTVKADFILVGERNLGDVSEIVPLPRRRAFKAMVKYMVVGLGIYHGMEFLLERGLWEVLSQAGVASSRLYNSLSLLARARPYRFILGRDTEKNSRTLIEFIQQNSI